MAGYFVTVTGNKSQPIGGSKERVNGTRTLVSAEIRGAEVHPFKNHILCRDGNESSVPATKGARCSLGQHQVKEGSPIYFLGLTKVCPGHLYLIPTMDELQRKFAQPWFTNVSIEIEKKG